ncbi:MAG: N-acetyl-gamma-glutamyl-phosphate reductase [Boseongicola sp. SB0662_bin_57]|nr:N-acetyl-gamma-glutamyl-phosphate reductase [Boseongicola sp. SB0662_bin_57]
MPHHVAILGASGYTGAELVRLISTHPSIRIAALTGDRKAGRPMSSVFPHLGHLKLPDLVAIDQVDWSGIGLAFCALPHATSQAVIPSVPRHVKVVDLSADFRLHDPDAYETWYGKPHAAMQLQKEAVYGLTEFYREDIRSARLVAGTGCNAAAGLYGLRPLFMERCIDFDDIVLDLKASVSGAGRSLKEHLLMAEAEDNVMPYSVGGSHRHLGEFDQELAKLTEGKPTVTLTPHLLPSTRGVVMTCYVKGVPERIHEALDKVYGGEVFIHVLPFGQVPQMKHVRASNFCHIGVAGDRRERVATVIVVLDNLTKGSSGQAIQNANLMLGEDETAGLMAAPVYP